MPCDYKKFVGGTRNSTSYLSHQTAHCPPRLPASSVIAKDGTGEHEQLNASKQGHPCKATRPRSQNFVSKRVIKLSSPTAAKTTHTADGKHPARYSSHSRESATPYVRNQRLKVVLLSILCRKRRNWCIY